MWSLWFIPLLASIFVGVLVVVVAILLFKRPKKPSIWLALLAAPFGCALLPIIGLLFLSVVVDLLQKSDRGLFNEIYGFNPEMGEGQMLSDDFGIWSDRSIYMRLQATPHDRERILAVADRSFMATEEFEQLGHARQFSWWDTNCDQPKLFEANGYREWKTLTIYDCLERQTMFIHAHRP
jgi:hypothetical protein